MKVRLSSSWTFGTSVSDDSRSLDGAARWQKEPCARNENRLREERRLSFSDGVFLRPGVSAIKNLPDPGRSMSIPFSDAFEKDIHLLVPTALYEGGEWTLGDTVGGGGGR